MTELLPGILVVDNQPDNRLILGDLLGENYRVHAVSCGEEALTFLDEEQPDLILLDIMMPGIDGFEVCRQLKNNSRISGIPLLFLSSLDSPADESHGLSLSAEDFIHKPFSAPAVLARVRNRLQLASAKRALKRRNEDLESLVTERTREIVRQSEERTLRTQTYVKALADCHSSHRFLTTRPLP